MLGKIPRIKKKGSHIFDISLEPILPGMVMKMQSWTDILFQVQQDQLWLQVCC